MGGQQDGAVERVQKLRSAALPMVSNAGEASDRHTGCESIRQEQPEDAGCYIRRGAPAVTIAG